jgi:hypothetical protein
MNYIKLMLVTASLLLTTLTSGASSRWPVFEAFQATPRAFSDRAEPSEERDARGRQIARAIEHASPDTHTQAALLALAQSESLFARRIQEDRCLPDECDAGKARGIWQLQRVACPDIWKHPPSFERLKREAECARRVYYAAIERCEKFCQKAYSAGLSGYRGKCINRDTRLRTRAFEAYASILTDGVPEAPLGWERHPSPAKAHRKAAQRILRRSPAPDTFIPIADDVGALAEWHWHDPSGPHRPKGWHVGLSLYRRKGNDDS